MSQLLVDTPSASTQQIQRAALLCLFDQLNDALEQVQLVWQDSDESFAEHLGRLYVPTLLEPVEPENFYEGYRPSLIKAPIEKYPNVAVMAYNATPGAGSAQYDHQETYRVNLTVEVMVKADPEEGEEICNNRAHRMVEATHFVMMRNPNLGGIVSGYDGTPSHRVTELFTRKERTSRGPHWYWQGGRLEYVVRKEAVLPSSHGPNFRAPSYEGLNIDQA